MAIITHQEKVKGNRNIGNGQKGEQIPDSESSSYLKNNAPKLGWGENERILGEAKKIIIKTQVVRAGKMTLGDRDSKRDKAKGPVDGANKAPRKGQRSLPRTSKIHL